MSPYAAPPALEGADDKCMPWKVPKATFGAGCTWGKELGKSQSGAGRAA